MKQYVVNIMIDGRSFGFMVMANSAHDAMVVARATYGPKATIRDARAVG